MPVVMILPEKVTKAGLEELIEGTQQEMNELFRFQHVDKELTKNLILLFHVIKLAVIDERE